MYIFFFIAAAALLIVPASPNVSDAQALGVVGEAVIMATLGIGFLIFRR